MLTLVPVAFGQAPSHAMATLVDHAQPVTDDTIPQQGPPMTEEQFVMDLSPPLEPPQQPQMQAPPNGIMAVTIVHQPPPQPTAHDPTMLHQHPQQVIHPQPTAPMMHPGQVQMGTRYKRHWLSNEQVAKVDEAFANWKGNWRGKEPQLKALASELGITVEKLKKRVDYMRRRREGKASGGEGGDGMSDDGGYVDDGTGRMVKRVRLAGGPMMRPLVPTRMPTEPYHPPKCLFTHNGCMSTQETGQIMIVVTPGCGHRWCCYNCLQQPYKVDEFIKLTGVCPTCRETPIADYKQLITITESELTKQMCKWCRTKNRNMAFTPCAHVSEYCTDCFDQAGNAYYSREEICTTCEQKFTKTLQL